MTLKEAIKSLEQIKTYTSAGTLDVVNYIVEILEKLEKAGITDPLNADFTKLK